MNASLSDELWAAYVAGQPDTRIAKQLEIEPEVVVRWRISEGLRGRPPLRKQDRFATNRWRQAVYEATFSDSEAAQQLGMSADGFGLWRARMGLPAKGHLSRSRSFREPILKEWQRGHSNVEIADKTGFHPVTVSAHLKTVGLKPAPVIFRRITGGSSRDRRYWQAYCLTASFAEAGEMLGVPAQAFGRWTRRQRLPRKNRPREFEELMVKSALNGDPWAKEACFLVGLEWRLNQ